MLLEAISFSLTEVKSQGKYACKLESRLKSKMKWFFMGRQTSQYCTPFIWSVPLFMWSTSLFIWSTLDFLYAELDFLYGQPDFNMVNY